MKENAKKFFNLKGRFLPFTSHKLISDNITNDVENVFLAAAMYNNYHTWHIYVRYTSQPD